MKIKKDPKKLVRAYMLFVVVAALTFIANPSMAYTLNEEFGNAVTRGDTKTVKALIDAGVDVKTGPFSNAFTSAAYQGNTKIVKIMINEGIDVNTPSSNGLFALTEAARMCRIDIVRKLIAAGADVNAKIQQEIKNKYSENSTALHMAVDMGCIGAVKILLKNGADPTLINKAGDTPMVLAAKRGYADIIKLLSKSSSSDIKQSTTQDVQADRIIPKNGDDEIDKTTGTE